MTPVSKVRGAVRLFAIAFIASTLLLSRPETGLGTPEPEFEHTAGIDYMVGIDYDNPPDPASVRISKEAAIRLSQEILPAVGKKNPDDIGLVNARLEDYGQKLPVWRAAWDFMDKGTIAGVTLDAMTGDLLAYTSHFIGNPLNEPNSTLPAGNSRDRAKKQAEAFIRKAVPSIKGFTLQEKPFPHTDDAVFPLFGPARYSFYFGLKINGYKVVGSSLTVVMDAAGNVKAFQFAGNPGQPVSGAASLTAAEAKRVWANGFKMKPLYRDLNESYGSKVRWGLTYEMDRTFWGMDAVEGTPDWISGGRYSHLFETEVESVAPSSSVFTPHKVNQDEAIQTAATFANFPAGVEWTSEYDNYDEKGERTIWELKGIDPDDREGGFYTLTVDAQTGQVLGYADYRSFERLEEEQRQTQLPTIKVAEARSAAEKWLAEHIPDFAVRYKSVAPSVVHKGNLSELELLYRMFQDGIPVADQTIGLTLDGKGKMKRLSLPSNPPSIGMLKALKPTIDERQAKKLIVQHTKLIAFYLPNQGYPFTTREVAVGEKRLDLMFLQVPANAEEGYAPDSVDAVAGQVMTATEDQWTAGGPLPADAQAHPSKVALQTLFDHGALSADAKGDLKPNAEISRGEFIRIVHRSIVLNGYPYLGGKSRLFSDVSMGHPYYDDIGYFVDRKWLISDTKTALKTESLLTREQMAVWLTKITGYEKMSRTLKDDPAVKGLRDAGKIKDKGAAAIVLKFKLMKPVNGSFNPGGRVTKAQAAEALLRLAEIQSQLDRPLWTWGYGSDASY